MDLVIVEWLDACFDLTDEDVQPEMMYTVGWITEHTDDFVRVACERDAHGNYRAFTAIPRGMIVNIDNQ